MKAIVISRPGGPEVLEYRELPDPEPAEREVRVKVQAAGVNRLDLMQRKGAYPVPDGVPQDIPGVEFAGVVDKLGAAVSEFKAGDRVFGLTGGGGYAQYVVVHAQTLMRIPDNLQFVAAAAVPEAFITAFDALVTQGGLAPDKSVLITAVGSGVGSAGVQIAGAFGGKSIGTARSEAKLQSAKELGLQVAIVASSPDYADAVRQAAGGSGVDIVMELVSGEYVSEDLKCLSSRGKIVLVGLIAGSRVDMDLGMLLRKRAEIRGTVLRARSLQEKIQVADDFSRRVIPLFEQGKLHPVVDKVFPLQEAAAAHSYMERNENFGKVILEVEQ